MTKENIQTLQSACSRLEGYKTILRAELRMNKIIKGNKKYDDIYHALEVLEDNICLVKAILTEEFGEYIDEFGQYMNKPE